MGWGFRWSINVSDSVFTVFPAGDSGASKFLNKLYVSFPITVKKMAVYFFSSVTSFAIKYCSTVPLYSVMLSVFKSRESILPSKAIFYEQFIFNFSTFYPIVVAMLYFMLHLTLSKKTSIMFYKKARNSMSLRELT